MRVVKPEFKYSELTGLIIKCAMAVHTALGNGFQEAYNLEVGLLINFGAPTLDFHRLNNKKFKPA